MQALPASFVLGEDEVEMMECKQTAGAGNWGGAVLSEQGSLLPTLLSAAYPMTLRRARAVAQETGFDLLLSFRALLIQFICCVQVMFV